MTAGSSSAGQPTDELVASDRLPIVPDWLLNLVALGWRILAVAAMVGVIVLIASTLWVVSATVAVSVVISAVLAPSVLRLRASGRTRTTAALIVWGVAVLTVMACLAILAIAFLPGVVDLASQLQAGEAKVQDDLATLGLPPSVGTLLSGAMASAQASVGDVVGAIVASAASVVTVLLLSAFLVFFLLQDGDRGWMWAFQGLGESKRERITTAGRDALVRVGGYLRGTTVLAALMAGTTFVFLILLGVPLAVPLTVLVFLAGYIPVFGGIVATIVVLLVAYASLGLGPTFALLCLMAVRNVILSYFVRPSVYSRSVSIHPAVVLIVLPAGYELAGVIGLFAAVPLTAVILAAAGAVKAIVDPVPRPALPGIVPGWLDRIAQWSWRILLVLAIVALAAMVIAAMPLVFAPLLLALVLAATLGPLVHALLRRGWARSRAIALVLAGGTLAVAGVLLVTVVVLVDQVAQIRDDATSGARSIDAATGGHLGVGVGAAVDGLSSLVGSIVSLAQTGAAVAVVLTLSLLLSFYFLRDGARLWGHLTTRLPATHRDRAHGAGDRAFEVLGGYMIGTAAISFVGAASQFAIMVILGIPLALPVAVLSFILCFIPYIGGFVSTGIAFLLTVATGTPLDVLIMAIWTIVFNIVQGNIVSPLVYGRTVHIHPAVVLLAIPAAAGVAGIMGMFIVVPVLGVVAATWRSILVLLADSTPELVGPASGLVAQTAIPTQASTG
jgi:putative heme transporter